MMGPVSEIYVREPRRMIGKYVMTENELTKKRPTPEPVGIAVQDVPHEKLRARLLADGQVLESAK